MNNHFHDGAHAGDAPARVLLVDDSPRNLQALSAVLESLPCQLLPVNSGEDALRCLLKDDAALILLDVNMPGMSGLETAALIRSRAQTRHIPIIFISADIIHAPGMLPQGYELGAVDYILKPFDPAVLKSKVTVFIDLYNKSAELRRQKEQLEELQAYTRSLVEANTDALITTDGEGRITDVNRQAELLTGRLRAALIGSPFKDLFTDPEMADFGIRLAMREGRLSDYELIACAADGRQTVVSFNASTFRGHGGLTEGVVASARDVTERNELAAERARHEQRVNDLSRRLVAVQEKERRRLAGIIHDRISPNLATAVLNLDNLCGHLPKPRPAELNALVDDTRALLDDAAAQMRDLSADLRPAVLDYAGLLPALDGYAQQFTERTGIAVRVTNGQAQTRLPSELESTLFRIVQEALHNCAKHSQASNVHIDLQHGARHALLTINDDGVGFVPELVGLSGARSGLGLLTMRERAEFAGGHFAVESSPGQGTSIRIEI
jgi:PAS domain S-box-containing protein